MLRGDISDGGGKIDVISVRDGGGRYLVASPNRAGRGSACVARVGLRSTDDLVAEKKTQGICVWLGRLLVWAYGPGLGSLLALFFGTVSEMEFGAGMT